MKPLSRNDAYANLDIETPFGQKPAPYDETTRRQLAISHAVDAAMKEARPVLEAHADADEPEAADKRRRATEAAVVAAMTAASAIIDPPTDVRLDAEEEAGKSEKLPKDSADA